ncbi:MAG TPA: ACT domain-containing protein, partial [Acidimicrobiales bacterium]|nr:ACT domain-containing protein [Acidimicrobiales bacterium]
EEARLRALHELIQAALDRPELTGPDARGLADLRRLEATALVDDQPALIERIGRAPLSYVLRQPPDAIARHAQLVDPLPGRHEARVRTGQTGEQRWWVEVGARDRPGLLATVTAALAAAGLDVTGAVVATWHDGAAIEAFTVHGAAAPDAAALERAIEHGFGAAPTAPALPDVEVAFDNVASPWHTVCEVRTADRPALLHDVAAVFDAAGTSVVAATATSGDDLVVDRFELTDRDGAKLAPAHQDAISRYLREGVTPPRRRFGRRQSVRA